MLRVVTLKKFDVSFIGSENSKDYNMVVSFSIEEDVGELFGNRPRRIIIPYYFGITDTTINDQNYNCIVFIDDEDKSVIAHEYVQSLFAFFVKKFEVFKEDIIPSEPAKTPQSIEERFGSKFRTIKGPDGNTSVNIGSDSVEFIAGDNKIIVSSNGISIYGNVTDYNLPSEINYIKTGNIKVPQCNEIAMRNAQGKYFLMFGDDQKIQGRGIKKLYNELNDIINKNGINNIILSSFKVKGRTQSLRYWKKEIAPIASLNSSLFDRKLLTLVKGVDIRFVGVYWDCDMAMRFQEAGINLLKSSRVWCKEYSYKKITSYLHRPCKPYDSRVLDSFWVKKNDGKINENDIWCYLKREKYVLYKKR